MTSIEFAIEQLYQAIRTINALHNGNTVADLERLAETIKEEFHEAEPYVQAVLTIANAVKGT